MSLFGFPFLSAGEFKSSSPPDSRGINFFKRTFFKFFLAAVVAVAFDDQVFFRKRHQNHPPSIDRSDDTDVLTIVIKVQHIGYSIIFSRKVNTFGHYS